MSKMKLLMNVVSDLRSLADSVQAIAEVIASNSPTDSLQIEKPKTDPIPDVTIVEKAVTLEQVRAVLAEKSHDGFTAEVRGLLEKHGAKKLSEIEPRNFSILLAEAEALK